jgi:Bacterial extracellular solute-binding protein
MTAGHTGRAPAHPPRRGRRGGTVLPLVLAAGIAATVFAGLAGRDVMPWARCSMHPVVVRVAVSGEIEPAIQRLGRFFNGEHQLVGGRCAQVTVRAASPAGVAGALARGGGSGVDAWIPDSALWLGHRGELTGRRQADPPGRDDRRPVAAGDRDVAPPRGTMTAACWSRSLRHSTTSMAGL